MLDMRLSNGDSDFSLISNLHYRRGINERSAIGGDSALALPRRRHGADRDVANTRMMTSSQAERRPAPYLCKQQPKSIGAQENG